MSHTRGRWQLVREQVARYDAMTRRAHRTWVSVPSSIMIRPVSASNCTCGARDGLNAAASAASRDSSSSASSAAEVAEASRCFSRDLRWRAALHRTSSRGQRTAMCSQRMGAAPGCRAGSGWIATHEPIDFIGLPRRRPFVITSASVIVGPICTRAFLAGAGAAAALPAPVVLCLGDVLAVRRIAGGDRFATAASTCAPLAGRFSTRSPPLVPGASPPPRPRLRAADIPQPRHGQPAARAHVQQRRPASSALAPAPNRYCTELALRHLAA